MPDEPFLGKYVGSNDNIQFTDNTPKIFRSSIMLKNFNFKFNSDEHERFFLDSLNYVPLLVMLKTNNTGVTLGTTMDAKDVIYLKLHNSQFLPEIEISCYDSKGIFFSDLYPLDHDTIFSIFVKSYSELLPPIRMDFRVMEYETIKSQTDSQILKYLIRGVLDLDDLHFTRFECRKGTSLEVLSKIAEDLKLGFYTNITESYDEMTWINPNDTYLEFISEITKKAYISETSFVWTFIDFYYNLNYIDIENELENYNIDAKEVQAFPQTIRNSANSTEEVIVEQYLTNNPAFNTTNKYITKFNLINQSLKINLKKSYNFESGWYDKKENRINKQSLIKLKIENKSIDKLYDEDSQLYEESDDYQFFGKLDLDNVHYNYALAQHQNQFNLEDLNKMKMVITLNQINFNIRRFGVVLVEIYNINDIISQKSKTEISIENINEKRRTDKERNN